MTVDRKFEAALALHRFGLGPVRGQITAIAGDPRGALLAELERPQAGLVSANLPSSGEWARMLFDYRAERQAKTKLAERAKKEAAAKDSGMGMSVMSDAANAAAAAATATSTSEEKVAAKTELPLTTQIIRDEAKVRYAAAVDADIGFVERLVWFWSNHFCISIDKIISMAGAYEREAIRPHVLGHFADMLQAAESHPAMLYYLDNVQSMGANSVAGINRDKGLNENLAREILELHTLGVRSGYSQTDVTSFANVLTGWSWIGVSEPTHGGEFAFVKRLHEPGDQVVLGKTYPDTGMDQGRAVLADLARHPATAQHVAGKLARHFVADEPPPSLVAKLEKRFIDSDGDLREVAKTLIVADESWTAERTKLKRPSEWILGILHVTGVHPRDSDAVGRVNAAQALLGEPLWRPPAPNGYPDVEAAWVDGVAHRLDIANEAARRLPPEIDPLELLDSALGSLASPQTRDTITHAESRTQALALLLMAPEYLRR